MFGNPVPVWGGNGLAEGTTSNSCFTNGDKDVYKATKWKEGITEES